MLLLLPGSFDSCQGEVGLLVDYEKETKVVSKNCTTSTAKTFVRFAGIFMEILLETPQILNF
jgi:hypothetical protein